MEVEEERRGRTSLLSIGTAGATLSSLKPFWINLSNVLLNHQMAIVGFVILQELKLSVDFGFNHRCLLPILLYTFSFNPILNLKFYIIPIPRWWF